MECLILEPTKRVWLLQMSFCFCFTKFENRNSMR